MKYLITGGCGLLGTNIAASLLDSNQEVLVFDNMYRFGSNENLLWLKKKNKHFSFHHGDVRNTNDVQEAVKNFKPDVIFHLAGQVAMTTSLDNPRLDFETNVLGSVNLLESVRNYSKDSIIVYSSTNKVYGDLEKLNYSETDKRYICTEYPNGLDENVSLDFHTPYGCSKGSADQYMLDYARFFNLKVIVFRHSSIYGEHQFSTYDQGWIGWFCQQALALKNKSSTEVFTISGNGKQVRDVLHVSDAVRCYLSAVENIETTRGQAFNIGGGMENSLSLLELFDLLETMLDVKLKYKKLDWRASDQKIFVADFSKAMQLFRWSPRISKKEGISRTIDWINKTIPV